MSEIPLVGGALRTHRQKCRTTDMAFEREEQIEGSTIWIFKCSACGQEVPHVAPNHPEPVKESDLRPVLDDPDLV